ncbi:radical SAM protein [Streptomyces violascens]|uniref:Radical SAM core domain-containing protein n=1 Tax=Streptomyces violascens TaxID=67381 RepID=A0ABQ3QL39_9ACTN|nr:radical SAM protein [Streptomyces violascens]GGU44457.1 hypothetical protein GCM10010289_76290 [Streptomyces violascens]GHI38000.1 hypothetical protein Sviol_24080 [Streptomyces violascens]
MHDVIVSPMLGGYLAVKPGQLSGFRLPEARYKELRALALTQAGESAPQWFADLARTTWDIDIDLDKPFKEAVLVRAPSEYGYARASWEINLGCNWECKHCYLGDKAFSGLPWEQKMQLLRTMRDAGVLYLQITGGEATIDKHFEDAYRYAFALGMVLTISTNGSRLWMPSLLDLFAMRPPHRIVVSVYGATEESWDSLTQRKGAWRAFQRGMAAAREAGLPLRLNIVVTKDSAHEVDAMIAMAEAWGVEHYIYPNMTPTIYGTAEPLLAQSPQHIKARKPYTGCNAGITHFHSDPHGLASICKVGRDEQINLITEGAEGLRRLASVSDRLMLRTGGCSGCKISGTCRVCRPMAKQYQEAKAPLHLYCQHGDTKEAHSA